MKRLIFILPVFLILMGCPPDETDDPQSTNSIVAKWKPLKMEYYENGQLIESELWEVNEDCPEYVEFKSDGTLVAVSYEETCEDMIEDHGTYTFSNNSLSTTIDGETEVTTIANLTDQELVFEYTYIEDGINCREIGIFVKIE